MENIHMGARKRFLLLLISKPSLSAKQIFARLSLKYKTVKKKFLILVCSGILLKDRNKLYIISLKYGDKLIDYGLKIKGLIKLPKFVLFLIDLIEIREKIGLKESYLKGRD